MGGQRLMAKIPDPDERLSPEGRTILAELIEKRGTVDGMYRTMLLNPDLTRVISGVGTYLRYGSNVLTDRQRELVILRVAVKTGAPYEWIKHVPPATEAGIPDEVIESMRGGGIPAELTDGERILLEATDNTLERKSLPEALQDELIAELGEDGTVELVILAGFYTAIAGFLAAFEVPLPDGFEDPFPGTATS